MAAPIASCEASHGLCAPQSVQLRIVLDTYPRKNIAALFITSGGTEYVLTREGETVSNCGEELTEDAVALIRPVIIEIVKED